MKPLKSCRSLVQVNGSAPNPPGHTQTDAVQFSKRRIGIPRGIQRFRDSRQDSWLLACCPGRLAVALVSWVRLAKATAVEGVMTAVRIAWRRVTPRVVAPGAVPLLLVQGFGCGHADWGALPKALASRSKREVLSFDHRGLGESDAPVGPYTMAELASDALGVLDEANIPKATLLGISLGGMVAQTAALERPDRVHALVLGCTTHGGREASPPAPDFVSLCEQWSSAPEPNASPLVEGFTRLMLPPEQLSGGRKPPRNRLPTAFRPPSCSLLAAFWPPSGRLVAAF